MVFLFNLENNKQFESIFNTNSDYELITHGVPQAQGSVLGPLFFLFILMIFINALMFLNLIYLLAIAEP